ncbi:MAG: tyrosine-protein phosphatase [Acidimicrobiia bacterium]
MTLIPDVVELVRDGQSLRIDGFDEHDHVELAWGTEPARIDTQLGAVHRDADDHLVIDDPAPAGVRPYLRVTTPDGQSRTVAERRLPLTGAPNTRDLGGYPTTDGRTVRWGRIYRSGALDKLTDSDLEYLERLGLALVVDVRRRRERSEMPSRIPNGAEVVEVPVGDTGAPDQTVASVVREGKVHELGAPGETLLKANTAFVAECGDQFRDIVGHLARAVDHPVLVHCTGGKDRAGFSSALMLFALGVPEEVVVYDYLRTNDFTIARRLDSIRRLEDRGATLEEVEILRAILEVRPEYIGAALGQISERHGSVDTYLRDALDLDLPRIAELRAHLVEA